VKIISKTYKELEIIFSTKIDKSIYINATKTAKEFSKTPKDWLRTQETKDYIQAISINFNINHNDLVKKINGNFSDGREQGTWIHKKLIIAFARWLLPDFAVWCDIQIEDITKTQTTPKPKTQLQELQETLDFIDIFDNFSEKTKGKSKIELLKLDDFLKKSGKKSVLDILNIDLKNSYFSVSELGNLAEKKGSEINQDLAKIGFQIQKDGVWQVLENGEKFCFETKNRFSQIKWKFEVLEKI